jgi:hypothetical protein
MVNDQTGVSIRRERRDLESGIEWNEIDCQRHASLTHFLARDHLPEGFARRRESTLLPLCGMAQLAACGWSNLGFLQGINHSVR